MDQRLCGILDRVGRLSRPAATLDRDADLYAVGLSSLATVEIMIAIEDEFDVEFPDRLLTRRSFQSLGALEAIVNELAGRAIA